MSQDGTSTPTNNASPTGKRVVGKPFASGFDERRGHRPRIEPRVRKYARRYDRAMCRTLAEIARDPKVPAAERRRAAMDLVAIGSGRPATTQELVGRPEAPLVSVNLGMQLGAPMNAEAAYRMMVEGTLEPDPAFFQSREVIDLQPPSTPSTPVDSVDGPCLSTSSKANNEDVSVPETAAVQQPEPIVPPITRDQQLAALRASTEAANERQNETEREQQRIREARMATEGAM